MDKFGKKLRILRKRYGYTLRELGDLLEVDHTFVSQLELGKRLPNALMILKISDTFNISIDLLMRDELEI